LHQAQQYIKIQEKEYKHTINNSTATPKNVSKMSHANFHCLLHYVITIYRCYQQTDRQKDRRQARCISVTYKYSTSR